LAKKKGDQPAPARGKKKGGAGSPRLKKKKKQKKRKKKERVTLTKKKTMKGLGATGFARGGGGEASKKNHAGKYRASQKSRPRGRMGKGKRYRTLQKKKILPQGKAANFREERGAGVEEKMGEQRRCSVNTPEEGGAHALERGLGNSCKTLQT